MDDLVWYASYGSNILARRFHLYIQGGHFPENNRDYAGCVDKTLPRMDKPIIIPFELYYGKRSPSWNGCGVAFIDTKKSAVTIGRAYLITEEQFEGVRQQEGAS